jgi:hypothetical protein
MENSTIVPWNSPLQSFNSRFQFIFHNHYILWRYITDAVEKEWCVNEVSKSWITPPTVPSTLVEITFHKHFFITHYNHCSWQRAVHSKRGYRLKYERDHLLPHPLPPHIFRHVTISKEVCIIMFNWYEVGRRRGSPWQNTAFHVCAAK